MPKPLTLEIHVSNAPCLLVLSSLLSSRQLRRNANGSSNVVIGVRFETGDDRLKELEHGTFVGAGRFLVEQGKPAVVEYRISKVAWKS